MIKNKLVRLFIFVIFVAVSLITLLAGISMTQTSSRWFVNWVIKTNEIPLTVEKVEGRLIDRLSLHDLHYKDKQGNEITLTKLVFDWSPTALFSLKAQINQIDLEGLTYQSKSQRSEQAFALPEFKIPSLPLVVSVDEININNIHLLSDKDERVIEHIKSSLTINDSELSFQLISLITGKQQLNGHVNADNNKEAAIEGIFNWNGELQQQAGQAILTIGGTLDKLRLSLEMNSIINAKVNGKVNLKDKPYFTELKGELDGKLLETYPDQFIVDKPVAFNLNGDVNHFTGLIETHAQLASGDGFLIKLETDGTIPGEKYDRLNLHLNWLTTPDDIENHLLSLKGQADVELFNQILSIDHDLQSPFNIALKGDINLATELLDLSLQWDDFSVPVSDVDVLKLRSGRLNAKGKLDAVQVSLDSEYLISKESSKDEKIFDTVSVKGEVNLLSDRPVGQLIGTVKASVPESLQEYLGSKSAVDFILNSELDAINIKANSNFKSGQLGPVNLELNANVKNSILTLDTSYIDVIEGRIEAHGQLDLEGKTKGKFYIKGQRFNFGVINPDLVSQLDINADVTFSETEKGFSTEANLTSLSGKWRGFPLSGSAKIGYVNDIFQIDNFNINSGDNTATINLTLDNSLSGFIDLSIHDLSLFSAELAGSIAGRMDVSGTVDEPGIEGRLEGNNIIVNDVRIASLIADSNIDLRKKQYSTLRLKLNSLHYQDYLFDEVLINADGLTEGHHFELSGSSSELNINAVVNAGLSDSNWSGKIVQLELNHKDSGMWQLSRPATYAWQINNNTFELQESCLTQNTAQLCFNAMGNSDVPISADITINRLPASSLGKILAENIYLKGAVSGDARFKLRDDNLSMTSNFDGSDIQLGAGYDSEPEYIDINTASLKLNTNNSQRELDIKLNSKDYFDFSFTGSMQGKSNHALQGKLDLVFENIEWLQNIEPNLTGSKGKFQTSVDVSGTFQAPKINGDFALKNGLVNILPIGLSLDKIQGQIKSDDIGSQLQINSILGSNDKVLSMLGYISLNAEKNYPYQFTISGENFPVIRTADVTMDVSPDIKLFGTKNEHNIRGPLTVPLLDMLISSVPESAVSLSPDVVVIQSKQTDAKIIKDGDDSNDFVKNHIDLDVDVFLKPDIHVKGFGLDTRLTGDIKITKPFGLFQPRAEGQVTLTDGSYAAYGQNLKIENGRLLFAGPLANPQINLRAYRPKLSVKAGVSISGDIRRPKLSLFSEPVQSEADTLSYLITGGPISGASGGEASLIAQAAFSMGTQESSVLTNQIKNMFGLDDFSIGGGNTIDSTAVSASKRLTQKLTFKSSFNPFDQLWAFFLNYKLTDNWSVQTESGVKQGADIIYSVESNTFSDLYKRFIDIISF